MDFKNVNIFAKGTWNGHKFIEDDLGSIVKNTNELVARGILKQPSLKLGHSTNQILKGQTDGDPALGRATNFVVNDGKITADFVDVPEILGKAIENGLYKQVSVELRFFEAAGWSITNVAILGADTPAVKTLEDLENYMTQAQQVKPVGSPMLVFSEPSIIKILEEEAMEDKTKALELELSELKAAKADVDAMNLELLSAQKDLAFAQEKDLTLETYKDAVKDGKLQPSILDKVSAHLDEQKKDFSGNLSISPGLVKEIILGYSEKLPVGEVSEEKKEEAPESTEDAYSEAVNKMVLETGKNYLECSDIVAKSSPKLLDNWKQSTILEG